MVRSSSSHKIRPTPKTPENKMLSYMDVFKALSDQSRVRALFALQTGELCVCQITELLALAPSTVSKHLSILKQSRLVETRKDGRWIYYRLSDQASSEIAAEVMTLLAKSLNGDHRLRQDRKRLKTILKIDPKILCAQQ